MALDESSNEGDTVVEIKDLKFVVDKEAAPHVEDCVVDYVQSAHGAGFTIKSTNSSGGCAGCSGGCS